MEIPINDSDNYEVINIRAYLADALLLISFGFFVGFIIPEKIGIFHRGFFCSDLSIQYPYKDDTFTAAVLLLYTFFMMLLTIIATEYYRANKNASANTPLYKLGNMPVNFVIVRISKYMGYAMIGYICVVVLTNVTKTCAGRLRPHFLDVCKPLNFTCYPYKYYTDYTCTGDPAKVLEARKSFFSGHASLAMYASTFTALYLLARMPRHQVCRIGVPIAQTALIAIGLLVSISRISDNKHHWSDVIIGIFVGMFAAAYTCYVWAGLSLGNEEEKTPLRQQNATYVNTAYSTTTEPYISCSHSAEEYARSIR